MSYSVQTRGRYGKGFLYTRKYLIDKAGVFPTGLLYIMEDYAKGLEIDWLDSRTRPKTKQLGLDTMFVNSTLRPYLEQREAAAAASREGRGIVVAPTGTGKSFIASLIIDEIQVPTLVVVPSLGLKRQLTASLREAFGNDMVGPLDRGRRKHFVTVENVDALNPNKPVAGIDCLLIDEFHHSGADTYRKLNTKAWSGVYFKFGLTATPFRSKSEERLLLESVLSRVIYEIPYELAVKNRYIVPMEAYYVDLPEIAMKGTGANYHAVYSALIANNDHMNELIANMVSKLKAEGISTLVLTKQIEHGAKIQTLCEGRGDWVPFAKGENDDNEALVRDFNKLRGPALIGTEGVLGEGVDTKPCEYVIDAGGGKSKNRFMQKAGRMFRMFDHPVTGPKLSGKLIMFRYSHNKWLLQHFEECMKHLRDEYGVIATQLSID